ncbi:PREDICTED: DUF724 domain-containing protein 2 [Tarenaya hassleriana]|uniref:DUF724 domain-containing protein 2 n=1 Tax=Tarenaya hassleriana TaxID=28532 RepID=UPI00053C35EA|nr:PREDICTED: DUF724 domain-containing protein 2 [Tarenaya hassleriana]
MRTRFANGDRVELERAVAGLAAYFPATVVRGQLGNKQAILIEFEFVCVGDSVHMREYVEPTRLRPAPPRELNRWFKAGEEVDAFKDGEGCWIKGNVEEIREGSRYLVGFGGSDGDRREIEIDHFNMRLHREWDDSAWVPPFFQLENAVRAEVKPKRIKLIIKFSGGEDAQECYKKGAIVEVRSDEDGYKDSWYSALIFNCLGSEKYIVEYLTLRRDDDQSVPLREIMEGQFIRPRPPPVSPIVRFKTGDKVDAWYNEGWWVGTVSRVLSGSKYIVYFSPTNEEQVCLHSNLRLHQDWINGEWVIPSKVHKDSNIELKCCKRIQKKPGSGEKPRSGEHADKPDTKFSKGMKVEVRSDEQGYEGSWFSATILTYLDKDRYTVEYHTLKTEDQTEFLREEAKTSDIRPLPPAIQRVYQYEPLEFVDAWFNEGWWTGQILKACSGMKYIVYFTTSNEELEFGHVDLRPHQEWINEEWVAASEDCSCRWLLGDMGN